MGFEENWDDDPVSNGTLRSENKPINHSDQTNNHKNWNPTSFNKYQNTEMEQSRNSLSTERNRSRSWNDRPRRGEGFRSRGFMNNHPDENNNTHQSKYYGNRQERNQNNSEDSINRYNGIEKRGRGAFLGRGRGDFSQGEFSQQRFGSKNDQFPQKNIQEENQTDKEIERPPIYRPQMPSGDPDVIFKSHIPEGIDFKNYNNIIVKVSGGNEKQDFISSFDECSLDSILDNNIKKMKYRIPTPIQKFTIPIILQQEFDIMGCAQTGSGKTAAYLIPTFNNILKNELVDFENKVAEPYILVVAPTRELANQICLEMKKFSFGTKIKSAMIYGGIHKSFVHEMIRDGCDSIAATPGRLIDFVNRGLISLEKVKYLILDEADRMLDLGFFFEIKKIVFSCGMPGPKNRRCYMFSATFPQEIRELAREILAPGYYFITVGMVGSAAESITQEIHLLSPIDKRNKLMTILEENKDSRILVFVDTKRSADFLTTYVCQKNFKATSIHGDRYQEQREEALRIFRSGDITILIATSVAARGLDIKDVEIVINFDLPSEIDEYVHRIGRTGRLGNKGKSISFFVAGRDEKISSDLVDTLKNAGQKIPEFLNNMDYAPIQSSGKNERDDRKISSRTHHVNQNNSYKQENKTNLLPYVEKVEEEWD